MEKETAFNDLEKFLEKMIKLFGIIDNRLINKINSGEKFTADYLNNNEKESKYINSKNQMLEAMKGSVAYAQDILKLFGETENTVSKILNYFIQFLGLVNGGISIGNMISSLFSFISGGGFITGAVHSGGAAGLASVNNIIRPQFTVKPDITVLVQSEVEKTKAVKFLRNYTPFANARNNLSDL